MLISNRKRTMPLNLIFIQIFCVEIKKNDDIESECDKIVDPSVLNPLANARLIIIVSQ